MVVRVILVSIIACVLVAGSSVYDEHTNRLYLVISSKLFYTSNLPLE